MTRDELIEAMARGIGEHRKGHGWERDDETWKNYTQIAEWALDAVLPLLTEAIAEAIDFEADQEARLPGGRYGSTPATIRRTARIALDWRPTP